ncbi:MAG: bifunctional tRNA (5-methylaminomethyl-2-thiouridine)(34)-methyltransferase MnmD/FAD-dependent 5-carboxymethylaminomethyl-2-thiouridine(34) oxidoreductase MnmC [Betaproteobacteria bacterium]|nr:bifunctional tRNA (5-methylaminomethyl-2-thiouridine)(34)-methyltransferase MnmD/FAD-dependent 5-carboxymethylaminomethyl-2-thiouridine(34) oxidoreductase MnmC [Betaproteobacteria bacterium]
MPSPQSDTSSFPAGQRAVTPAALAFTADGTPCSAAYDDVYHAVHGAAAQVQHVFLRGNGLPQRWRGRESFTIVETGFGLGLNFLETWAAWRADTDAPARLHFVSTEQHPLARDDLARALGAAALARFDPARTAVSLPAPDESAAALCAAWPPPIGGCHRIHFEQGRVTLTLLLGDALAMLTQLDASADAFYLDGFSPAKNPAMWSDALYAQLARLAAPDATLATWTVAAQVRTGLAAAGFSLAMLPGFAPKRDMLAGRRASSVTPLHSASHGDALHHAPVNRRAAIIGAGLAGTACAARLAARGWEVELIERNGTIANGASGNPGGILQPILHVGDTANARLSWTAFLYALRHLDQLPLEPSRWRKNGVLQIARDERQAERFAAAVAQQQFPRDWVRFVDADGATALAGREVARAALWFGHGASADSAAVCAAQWRAAQLAGGAARLLLDTAIQSLDRTATGWRLLAADGALITEAPVVILANAHDCTAFAQARGLPLEQARGQISYLPPDAANALAVSVSGEGYCTPLAPGGACVGASFDYGDTDGALRGADHAANIARLAAMLPGFGAGLDPLALPGRVAFRATTPDRLPIAGALAPHEGLYVLSGLGARGLTWAPLLAEMIAAQLCGEPSPIERDLARAVSPQRFARAPGANHGTGRLGETKRRRESGRLNGAA